MANKRQRKKAAQKAARSFEGQQYRGGRTSGRQNLKRTNGNIINQHGVKFTESEKRALENAVNAANRKRKKMLKEAATLPRMVAGKETGDTVGSLQLMGKESDFILAKKTKSLQRFQTRQQYNKYMKRLNDINTDFESYMNDRIRLYKRNHIKALENAYGDDAKDIAMKIRMMKPKDYMKMIEKDETLEISYIYDPSERSGKLNQMRASMGMKLKEDDLSDEELPY